MLTTAPIGELVCPKAPVLFTGGSRCWPQLLVPQELGAAWGREPPLRLAGGPALLGPASCSTVVWVLLLIELLGEEMGVEVRPPVTSEILVVAHWIREFFADPAIDPISIFLLGQSWLSLALLLHMLRAPYC